MAARQSAALHDRRIAASRVLIGQHYFTDVVLGAIIGTAFPLLCARPVRRALLALPAHSRWRLPAPGNPHPKMAQLAASPSRGPQGE
jgi:membrane-associated phospholipid phosphatase